MKRRPPRKGVYALLIQLPRQETVRVGRLGPVSFAKGIYVYVGSALNSLPGRVSRHVSKTKRKHWHIDYLLDRRGVRLIGVATKIATSKLECNVSRNVQAGAFVSVDGFGCSDCNCLSHLHHFKKLDAVLKVLAKAGLADLSLN